MYLCQENTDVGLFLTKYAADMRVCLQDATSGQGLLSGKTCLKSASLTLKGLQSVSMMFYREYKDLLYLYLFQWYIIHSSAGIYCSNDYMFLLRLKWMTLSNSSDVWFSN